MKMSVVIQAGGESKRMGRDKGLVPFLGQPLIQRVVERVKSIADEILVTSNCPEEYQFLGIPIYPDVIQKRGALTGLYTALWVAHCPLVAVVACDLAFVSAKLLEVERDCLKMRDADGVVPRTATGYEPFHAVYRRETCVTTVKKELDRGQCRVDSWFSQANIVFLLPEIITLAAPDSDPFVNLNTPAELQRAEIIAREHPEK